MAGSITVTTTDLGRGVTKYSIAWVSGAGGDVSGNAFTVKTGELRQVKFVPDGGGTAPTDLYDVTVTDANGVDILGGTGANLSSTTAAIKIPVFGFQTDRLLLETGDLTPTVAAAGNAKGGTIILYVA